MGVMTHLRVVLGLLAERILRQPIIKDFREWWSYRRWLRRCVGITIEDLADIYQALGIPLSCGASAVKNIIQGDLQYYKRYLWRAFPLQAVDKLEQLFFLYRSYQRELAQTRWKKPDPRSVLFQRFWREENANSRRR